MSNAASEQICFNVFTSEHLDGAVRLSREAQWPHRREDWALALSVSTGFVALDNDEVVGTALCSAFGDVATLNMIIVDQWMRGLGLGRKLMERIIAAAEAREMRLVATAAGLPLYEKLGFQATGEIVQHQGTAHAAEPECAVEVVENADVAELVEMDRAASGMERGVLLAQLAGMGTVLRGERGFAMLRPFGRGHVLGPLVARDAATARALMAAAANRVVGEFLRIDIPADHAQADYAHRLGLAHAGGGTSMVRAPRPRAITEHLTFALVSQALG